MEARYAKLYEKYTTLKEKTFSELDEVNKDQEEKFLHYVSVAEDLRQHLKGENARLKSLVDELRTEIVSVGSTENERFVEYQKLLLEEKQKNKMLCEEVERLQNSLSSKGNMLESPHAMNRSSERSIRRQRRQEARAEMENAVISHGLTSPYNSSMRTTRKHSREDQADMGGIIKDDPTNPDARMKRKRTEGAQGEAGEAVVTCGSIDQNDTHQESSKRTGDGSGRIDGSEREHTNCQFQALVEYLVGMKLSTINLAEGVCVSALHQSSGYSFTLTWIKKAAEDEPELLYRVSALGTFERIAPEWMRSDIMFSMNMCPIFFQRVARVIKMQ